MTEENPIPLFKVFMSDDAINLTSEVLSSGYVTQGPEVEKFEQKLKNYFSNESVVSVNSATSGLHLIFHMLKNFGLGPEKVKIDSMDDYILTTPLTCTASNWPI